MSIQYEGGKIIPTCDLCGDTLEPADDFDEAKDRMNAAGWFYDAEYDSNYCVTCQNGGEQ